MHLSDLFSLNLSVYQSEQAKTFKCFDFSGQILTLENEGGENGKKFKDILFLWFFENFGGKLEEYFVV